MNVKEDNSTIELFKDNLKKIRKLNHLTQAKFADIMGLSRVYINELENGRRNPSFQCVFIASAKLQMPPPLLTSANTLYVLKQYPQLNDTKKPNSPFKNNENNFHIDDATDQEIDTITAIEEKHINKLIGQNVSIMRKKRSLTQEELSKISGVSRSYISDIENGKRAPTLKIIDSLAHGLNCLGCDLFEVS